MTTVPLLQLREVGLEIFKPIPTTILQDVNLDIAAAAKVAVVGSSGAGKTSLVTIIGALQSATSGSYLFQGEPVERLDSRGRAAFRAQHVGFVFQNANLIDERSALQNVTLGLTDLHHSASEAEERAVAALEQVGLSKVASRRAALLSGGERQRVAVARALVKKPSLIIADEPTGALDQSNGAAILDLLFALDATLLMVTHDQRAAARAQQIITIVDGKLI